MTDDRELFESLYHRGVKALARKERSRKELLSFLSSYCNNKEIVQSVATLLVSEGVLSDQRFASSVCRRKSASYGVRYVEQLLKSHDISGATVEEELGNIKKNELESARRLLSKKLRQQPSMPVNKQSSFLYSRGFSRGVIDEIVMQKSQN